MSTDLVLVARTVEEAFRATIVRKTSNAAQHVVNPINKKSEQRIDRLIADAKSKGASSLMIGIQVITILDKVSPDMEFWHVEGFGPVLGLAAYDDESSAVQLVNDSPYGLSAAVHSRNHLKALGIAKQLETAAVHFNSATVHDEAILPHGGRKESGFGRFGAQWGFDEFMQTKTIILHP
jgi:acyl-CoA reductase-like NAD-dependent aldehyde dehydrogenase